MGARPPRLYVFDSSPLLTRVAAEPVCGYRRDGLPFTEPSAWSALALAAHGKQDSARKALDELVIWQTADGGVPVSPRQEGPSWSTALAILAWKCAAADPVDYAQPLDKGLSWLLNAKGKRIENMPYAAHDGKLVGWAYINDTHSWVEPTALSVLALKASGHGDHPRTREAVRLLVDRLIATGGANYGNTIVLGNTLRPHVQPSALTLLALHGEADEDGRIAATVDYVQKSLELRLGAPSFCYGLLALSLFGKRPPQADAWLAEVSARLLKGPSPLADALCLLAALPDPAPLLHLTAPAP